MANEQLPSSSSPTLVSESTSTVQTESESSDGSSDDADDEKSTEQSPIESVQSNDENDQRSDASDNEDKGDENEAEEKSIDGDDIVGSTEQQQQQPELVTQATVHAHEDKPTIDMDAIRYKNLQIIHDGRDILDFSSNVANRSWNVQYAHLPEKNYPMYINNRSQYNRLASGYEPNSEQYSLNRCSKCAFYFPVLADIPDKLEQTPSSAGESGVVDLLNHTLASIVSRHSPIQNINALAQKLSAQTMASSIHAPTAHSMGLNNFMLNNSNNAAVNGQSYNAYQNQNQNRNRFANAAAFAAAAAANSNNTNSQTCYKHNNSAPTAATANAFYGNNNVNNVVLNALVNQIGNMNNSPNAFSANFMNALNGTNNGNDNANTNNNTNHLNQLSNAALANLMNQNRQQQLYGMCRQNINKSGINFNANSHKSMPTYSHF